MRLRVAGLADRTSLHTRAAGMFARNRSAVSHQLARVRKARDLTEFGHDTDGGNLRNTAQCLQSVNHRAHLGRCDGNSGVDRLLELFDTARHVLNFVQIVDERGLLSGLFKVLRSTRSVGIDVLVIPDRTASTLHRAHWEHRAKPSRVLQKMFHDVGRHGNGWRRGVLLTSH